MVSAHCTSYRMHTVHAFWPVRELSVCLVRPFPVPARLVNLPAVRLQIKNLSLSPNIVNRHLLLASSSPHIVRLYSTENLLNFCTFKLMRFNFEHIHCNAHRHIRSLCCIAVQTFLLNRVLKRMFWFLYIVRKILLRSPIACTPGFYQLHVFPFRLP